MSFPVCFAIFLLVMIAWAVRVLVVSNRNANR